MSVNYTLGDALIKIKNASAVFKKEVLLNNFKIIRAALDALKRAGFIENYEETEDKKQLRVRLKYRDKYTPYVGHVKFFSKPGRRLYVKVKEITPVRSGVGVVLISTPKGILTSNEAKKENVGGEIICEIW